jgi:hypothetical protein
MVLMSRMEKWLATLALCGAAAGALAAGLLWMVFTRPVALVEALNRLW